MVGRHRVVFRINARAAIGFQGFTAALVAVVLGSVLGPALAGGLITLAGSWLTFFLLALPSLGVAGARRNLTGAGRRLPPGRAPIVHRP